MINPAMQPVDVGHPNRPSAKTHNAFIQAARAMAGQLSALGAVAGPARPDAPVLIRIFNNTGDTLKQFAPAAVDEPMVDLDIDSSSGEVNDIEAALTVVLKVKVPDADADAGKFVIAAEPIADQQIGLAFCGGVCVARVQIDSDSDTFADVQSNTEELLTGTSGAAQILWMNAGSSATGSGYLAIIRFGGGAGGGNGMVQLVKDGGSTSGDLTHQCANTYTGYAMGATIGVDDPIFTGKSVDSTRPTTGKLLDANLGFYDSGSNKLFAYEAPDTGTCP